MYAVILVWRSYMDESSSTSMHYVNTIGLEEMELQWHISGHPSGSIIGRTYGMCMDRPGLTGSGEFGPAALESRKLGVAAMIR